MCTVTYLPLSQGGFIITSNRDESIARTTLSPTAYTVYKHEVFFPKDNRSGGSWFAATTDYTVVLLNGAAEKHAYNPPYKKSRGLVLLDFFLYNHPKTFIELYDFDGIEPFTLVIANAKKNTLHRFRWNGTEPTLIEIDPKQAHIWSSATLYDEATRKERSSWFVQWLEQKHPYEVENILHFHHFGGKGDKAIDLVMNREDKVQTVSITSFENNLVLPVLWYKDIAQNTLSSTQLT